jgi:hypothetical protein
MLSAEDTREWILSGIKAGQRRIFIKFGDGELLAIQGSVGQTMNGDIYTPDQQVALHDALLHFAAHPDAVVAKWPDEAPYAHLREMHADHLQPRYADYTSLLLQRGNERQMHRWWLSIRDLCDINYVAPERMAPVAKWLGARHHVIAESNADIDNINPTGDLVIIGAGFAAKRLMHRLSTTTTAHLLDVGSGLDSLVVGITRENQPDPSHVRNIFGL